MLVVENKLQLKSYIVVITKNYARNFLKNTLFLTTTFQNFKIKTTKN